MAGRGGPVQQGTHRPIPRLTPRGCRFSSLWCSTRHASRSPAGASAPPGWRLWILGEVTPAFWGGGNRVLGQPLRPPAPGSTASPGLEPWSSEPLDASSVPPGPVRVPLWVRPGSLAFPETPGTPVIMVGPGTGVAPFRAAVQERVAQGQTGEGPGHPGSWAGWQLGLTRPGLTGLWSPRKLPVLWLPLARPGLLLGIRVGGAREEGLPDALHGLLPGTGVCAGRGGRRDSQDTDAPAPSPAPAPAP